MQSQGDVIPQNQPLFRTVGGKPGGMVLNDAGGYVYQLDDMKRLERFLVIGCEGGSYFAKEQEIKRQNITCIDRLISAGKGVEVVNKIKTISVARRNMKQQAILLAFAICARSNDLATKKAAYAIINDILRIPTHLFMFIKFCEQESHSTTEKLGPTGWGRAHKRAIGSWYLDKEGKKLAYLITKYRNREDWTHKDVVRLAHPSTPCPQVGFVLRYIIKGYDKARKFYDEKSKDSEPYNALVSYVGKIEEARLATDVNVLCELITENNLSWEHCPSQLLASPEVWKTLLSTLGDEALLRNLGRMTALGLFESGSEWETKVLERIRNFNKAPSSATGSSVDAEPMEVDTVESQEPDAPTSSRGGKLHPFRILIAMEAYRDSKGLDRKGSKNWTPNEKIKDALDDAFYKAFEAVEKTGLRYYLGVDVSGSMGTPVLGSSTIYCSTAAAAMMMVTARTEDNPIIKGFSHSMKDLRIGENDKLQDVIRKTNNMTFGATDCAQPMIDAMENKIKDIDVFIVYTDCETWAGKVHPSVALQRYRQYARSDPDRPAGKSDAKLIVVGMSSNEFTLADPNDPGMFDIAGFDSAAPSVISQYSMGKI